MGKRDTRLETIRAALSPHGILVRGSVRFRGDGPAVEGGRRAACVVLLGNVGGSIWPAFSEWLARNPDMPDPLDTWSASLIRPVADVLDATAYFPSERPWQPFQQWAMRAEGLRPSPLGILVHREYGLWHGYRGAIGFADEGERVEADADAGDGERRHPCDHCADKPCLHACPAGAVKRDMFDVPACRSHLAQDVAGTCLSSGCLARHACPVGASYRYPPAQSRFHMDALGL